MSQPPDLDLCIRSVVALVMSLQDAGASPGDVIRALEAAARCEGRLRAHVESELNGLIDKITPDNLHPAFD